MRTKGPLKHQRDAEQDDALAEEETLARGAAKDARDVMLITVTGLPWFDSLTGKQLDEKKTLEGMQRERDSLNDFS
eukprot:6102906-Heterocapsa_arctica.AAC.1